MANDYVIISNGVVVNALHAGADYVAEYAPGAVDVTALDPRPGIGWGYANGAFTAPAAAAPSNPIYSGTDFMALFTLAELVACLVSYASSATLTQDQKNNVTVLVERFRRADTVDLTNPATVQGVQYLESVGLLGTGRAAQILASRH